MSTDADNRFEPLPDRGSRRPPTASGDEPGTEESLDDAGASPEAVDFVGQRRHWATGPLFGALVGFAMGAVVGPACCWVTGAFELFWNAVLVGGILGALVGAVIGPRERTRSRLVRPDTATLICGLFGVIPALLLCLQCAGVAGGRFTLLLFIGVVFTAPMLGLLVGGAFDRSFEACMNRSRRRAFVFALAGVAACLGLIWALDALTHGPDPEEIARRARAGMITEWRKSPDGEDAKIHELTLERTGRVTYAGVAVATYAGQRKRYRVEAWLENGRIWVQWTPLDE